MQNKLNINDWSSVQSLFDKLNKQMEKAQKATETLGAPRVYIKLLVELEVRIPAKLVSRHACHISENLALLWNAPVMDDRKTREASVLYGKNHTANIFASTLFMLSVRSCAQSAEHVNVCAVVSVMGMGD